MEVEFNGEARVRILLMWLISALALWLMAWIIPGVSLRGFGTALIAAVVIAAVNGTVGLILKVLAFPLTVLTLGLFLLVINGLLLKLSAVIVPGFEVRGCLSAILGSVVLTILISAMRHIVF